MGGKLFFEIPDDQETMVKLVEAVPSDWSWLDGGLYAPKSLIASGAAEKDTGFTLERFHDIQPTIIGYNRDEEKKAKPNLFGIIVEQKLPGFIWFNEAGYGYGTITLELAKRIAVSFLQKGYRGGLHFYRSCYNNHKYDNSARCSLALEPWHGAPIFFEEAGDQPARVKLEWEERYGGEKEYIEPIMSVCHSLKLREYTPKASDTSGYRL